jgi:hypothetical protein
MVTASGISTLNYETMTEAASHKAAFFASGTPKAARAFSL